MSNQSLISRQDLDNRFVAEIERLKTDWKPIKQLHQDLTKKQIVFGQKILNLYDTAKRLDKADDGEHYAYLRESLEELIGSGHPAILSKWVAIGRQSKRLLPHSSSLPAQRDSLYELALAANDKKPIEKWIRDGSLSSESTVREVLSLRRPRTSATKSKSSSSRAVVVTLTLSSKSYSEAAKQLQEIISSENVSKVRCQSGFREAMKSLLGRDGYEEVSKKFS